MDAYDQVLDYLLTKLPMFSRIGAAAIKKDLTNTIALCNALRNPQNSFKTIHIAGTNGKGSTSHMLAAILQSAGYKTGLYTSPHLKDFRERIRINGSMIPKEYVTQFVKTHQPLIETTEPSFFEITVALAFEYFASENVDIAIIETGLGGRLDSTNIIQPEVSVITNIGWDHMQLLGNSLEAIAFEKAGIIKKHTPVVIGETQPETTQVFIARSAQEHAPISFADQQIVNDSYHTSLLQLEAQFRIQRTGQHIHVTCDLPARYQIHNIATALETIFQMQQLGWHIDQQAIQKGLASVKSLTGLQGRWDCIHTQPRVIVDVGHNTDGMTHVLQQLQTLSFRQLHWIIGMVSDKDIDKVLALLPKNAQYYFTKAQIPRALPVQELQQKASAFQLQGHCYDNVNIALNEAILQAGQQDLILICGSVFVAGEIDTAVLQQS